MTLIPLGALVVRAAGRSPVLGCVVAYVSISAGYDASPSLTATDVLLSSISTAASRTIDPDYRKWQASAPSLRVEQKARHPAVGPVVASPELSVLPDSVRGGEGGSV